MRAALLALAVCLLGAAPAIAALQRDVLVDVGETGPVAVDLDGDGTRERLASPLLDDGFLHRPALRTACGRRRLGPRNERVAIELLRVHGSARPPLLAVWGSSGASGRVQATRVHRVRPPRAGSDCPRVRTVFRFPHPRTRTPPPPEGTTAGSFSTAPREVRGRIWMRTTEGLYRRSDGGCCPSYVRTIDWRPDGGRYVRDRTRTRRTPQP